MEEETGTRGRREHECYASLLLIAFMTGDKYRTLVTEISAVFKSGIGIQHKGNTVLQNNSRVSSLRTRSREFFHRLLQLVIFKTEDLSEIGELPDGFIQMTRAFVTPVLIPEDDGASENPPVSEYLGDYLVTEIAYQPQGSGGERGAFRFTYFNEQNKQKLWSFIAM